MATYLPIFVFFHKPSKNVYWRHTNYTKKSNIISKNNGIKELHKASADDLVNAMNRYNSQRESYRIRRKFKKIYPKFIKKQNLLEDDLRKARKPQNVTWWPKKLAKLRDIKNDDILAKEDLIYTLLRSEKNIYQDNYEKYISNNTTNELRSSINIIRMLLARLGDIITKNDRDKIRKKLYEIENKPKVTKTQKERHSNYLINYRNYLIN